MKENNLKDSFIKEMNWQKGAAIVILIIALLFLLFHVSDFKRPAEFAMGKTVTKYEGEDPGHIGYVDFKGSQTISRTFIAREGELQRVSVGFFNTKMRETTGSVTVTVLDPDGKTLASSEMKASMVLSVDNTVFDMVGRDNEELNTGTVTSRSGPDNDVRTIKLKKGETYTVRVDGHDINNSDRFDVKVLTNDEPLALDNNLLFMIIKYYHKQTRRVGMIVFMILLALAVVCCPREYLSRLIAQRTGRTVDVTKLLTRMFFFLTPLVTLLISFVIIDVNARWIAETMREPKGFFNLFVIVMIWLVLYAILNSTKWSSIATTFLWTLFVFANYVLLQFRNQPLLPSDFASFGTAMDVAGNYQVSFNSASICALSLAAVWIAMLLSMQRYRGLPVKKRLVVVLAACMYVGSFWYIFFETDYLFDRGMIVGGFRPQNSYNKLGYPLAFSIALSNARIDKPEGYSLENVKEITSKYPSDPADDRASVSEKRPNVIVVMNESLADISELTHIETENDFLPFIRGLKENTVRGTLHMSVFGGQTANSEYEFLTNNSIAMFPVNGVPFNSNLKENTPSLARTMKQLGYGGLTAFHPGMRDSYNRDHAYPDLGFEKHIALDDLNDPELVRTFVSDSYDYRIVEQEYENFRKENGKKPFFMFNVTIQNHGDFALRSGVVEDTVKIKDPLLNTNLVRQYLNLVKISDDAFKELIEYFKKVKEPTAIVLYGDHQPNLGEDFTAIVDERSGDKDLESPEHIEKRYQTPFLIWTNYDIREHEGVQLSDNYLSAFVLRTLGLPMTGYDKFIMDLSREVPFYSAIAYSDRDGNVYAVSDDSKCSDLIRQYRILQYNNIVDRDKRETEFFRLAE